MKHIKPLSKAQLDWGFGGSTLQQIINVLTMISTVWPLIQSLLGKESQETDV